MLHSLDIYEVIEGLEQDVGASTLSWPSIRADVTSSIESDQEDAELTVADADRDNDLLREVIATCKNAKMRMKLQKKLAAELEFRNNAAGDLNLAIENWPDIRLIQEFERRDIHTFDAVEASQKFQSYRSTDRVPVYLMAAIVEDALGKGFDSYERKVDWGPLKESIVRFVMAEVRSRIERRINLEKDE